MICWVASHSGVSKVNTYTLEADGLFALHTDINLTDNKGLFRLKDILSTLIFWLPPVFGIICILIAIWIRWRSRASRSSFALSVIGSLAGVMGTILSAIAFGLDDVFSAGYQILFGVTPSVGEPDNIIIKIAILLFGSFIAALIYKLAVHTLSDWDTSLRVSELKFTHEQIQNNLVALAVNGVVQIISRDEDPPATDAIAAWRDVELVEPKPVERHILLRDLFVTMLKEATIRDSDWRDKGMLWVGRMYKTFGFETFPILLMVFDDHPTDEQLLERLNKLGARELDPNTEVYGVYLSNNPDDAKLVEKVVDNVMVKIYSSRSMILESLDLKHYARQILDMYNSDLIGGTKSTLAKSYVDLKVNTSSESSNSLNLELEEWEKEISKRHLAIIGEYGQGKSSALLNYCADWAEKFIRDEKSNRRIPLLIELRGKSPAEADTEGFLASWCHRYDLNAKQVLNLIRSGGATVIFEGFDELKNAGREYDRHVHFQALWKFAFPNVKLIFTGRPNLLGADGELERTLRVNQSRGAGGSAYSELLAIQPMTTPQIKEACRDYAPEVQAGILAAARKEKSFLDIVSRPSMLPVVATIWPKVEKMIDREENLTGASLLDHYITAVFERKEAELEKDRILYDAPENSRYLKLPLAVRVLLTQSVAWQMAERRLQNTIPRADVADIISLAYEPLRKYAESEFAPLEITNGMRNFEQILSESPLRDKLEIITTEICTAGLLVPDPVGGNTSLRFSHKQFFEFFVAEAACIILTKEQTVANVITRTTRGARSVCVKLARVPVACKYFCQRHLDVLKCNISVFTKAIAYVSANVSYFASSANGQPSRNKSYIREIALRVSSVMYTRDDFGYFYATNSSLFFSRYLSSLYIVIFMSFWMVHSASSAPAFSISIFMTVFPYLMISIGSFLMPFVDVVSWGSKTTHTTSQLQSLLTESEYAQLLDAKSLPGRGFDTLKGKYIRRSYADRNCLAIQELFQLDGKFSREFDPTMLSALRNPNWKYSSQYK